MNLDNTTGAAGLLILRTDLGLGNRLMAMANWSAVCTHVGRVLRVIWLPDASVAGASFNELFASDLIIDSEAALSLLRTTSRRLLQVDVGISEKRQAQDLELINHIPIFPEQTLLVTMSCYFEPAFMPRTLFYSLTQQFLQALVLEPELLQRVNRFCEEHEIDPSNPRVMGLHIRRTDRPESAQVSSNAAFEEIIRKEICCWSAVRFFLATECQATQEQMLRLFPHNVFVMPKTYQEQGIRTTSLQDAVIELYVLSRCHHIYGSYGSSFSKVASILRGIKFHQVGFV